MSWTPAPSWPWTALRPGSREPFECGSAWLADDGLRFTVEDDYYDGIMSPAQALELAAAIQAKWGPPSR